LPEARIQQIVALCKFDEMRRQNRAIAPSHKRFDTDHHLNKGIAGRGEEVFPRSDFPDEYRVLENALGSECFRWLNKTP
jgi:hypothetical protein